MSDLHRLDSQGNWGALLRAAPWHQTAEPDLSSEWLVTNGLGGYASGTVFGTLTRRYHGLLIAAFPNPLGRFMTLNVVDASIESAGESRMFMGPRTLASEASGELMPLSEFRLEEQLPVWIFRFKNYCLEKRLLLTHGQNTVMVGYTLRDGPAGARLDLWPGVNFRPHDAAVSAKPPDRYSLNVDERGYEVSAGAHLPCLRLLCEPPATLILDTRTTEAIVFAAEQSRGYDFIGSIYSPGHFSIDLEVGSEVTLIASTETWEVIQTLCANEAFQLSRQRRRILLQDAPRSLRTGVAAELVLAADQFLIKPVGRLKDEVRARAGGGEVRTVIAGYHWFADWGRDTMISLEGLALTTGRHTEAGWILRTFAHYIRAGLIPNYFPEGHESGLYHTADATLWFFHALSRYLDFTGDVTTLRLVLPRLQEIMAAHLQGTQFGIKVDPADGLLSQGAAGYQLTWMDAKVDDWVVTPRRGKAVEINALWFNALCCMAEWLELLGQKEDSQHFSGLAERARVSFNRRFWRQRTGYLYDVVDGESGDDPACRPNQIFAVSLPHPVLDEEKWPLVVDVVTRELLTPVGLRSLSPADPDYKSTYDGDLRARDSAYHQGAVWAWLIGPYIDAWLKIHPAEKKAAQKFLDGFIEHLDHACIGSISEIFDGDPPHTPRGCIAQAWSVAEVLRCWDKTNS
jgi:predicted glycogen debranching enzyme